MDERVTRKKRRRGEGAQTEERTSQRSEVKAISCTETIVFAQKETQIRVQHSHRDPLALELICSFYSALNRRRNRRRSHQVKSRGHYRARSPAPKALNPYFFQGL